MYGFTRAIKEKAFMEAARAVPSKRDSAFDVIETVISSLLEDVFLLSFLHCSSRRSPFSSPFSRRSPCGTASTRFLTIA